MCRRIERQQQQQQQQQQQKRTGTELAETVEFCAAHTQNRVCMATDHCKIARETILYVTVCAILTRSSIYLCINRVQFVWQFCAFLVAQFIQELRTQNQRILSKHISTHINDFIVSTGYRYYSYNETYI